MIDVLKATPILFSTPMVQTILNGKKKQTRRVINPQPRCELRLHYGTWNEYQEGIDRATGSNWGYGYKCPYGKPGDILWVRETWGIGIAMSGGIVYRADYKNNRPPLADGEKWKPSIHMPKDIARIYLRVTDVRAERLQSITEEDALKEGFKPGYEVTGNGKFEDVLEREWTAVDEFRELWQELNLKRGYGWDKNPWVWVVEFERVEKE